MNRQPVMNSTFPGKGQDTTNAYLLRDGGVPGENITF